MRIELARLKSWERHEVLVSLVNPRPIAWVSTIGEDGTPNAAPYSFFTPVGMNPPAVAFSMGRRRGGDRKDTQRNIEATKEFVVNVVDEAASVAMNKTGFEYPPGVNEMARVGLTMLPSEMVRPPRIGEAPAALECRLLQAVQIGAETNGNLLVIGEVLLAHVRDDMWNNTEVDPHRARFVGRMGGELYCLTDHVFEMKRWREPPA
ncbi:MAG: flavin reductase family protein [Chloroflexi bacterium]|nr:flavin reductase family protein [Chloroflexota bacterium]